jgi:hypothetical protein
MSTLSAYEKEIAFQSSRRRAGVELIKIISDLWYDKSIEMPKSHTSFNTMKFWEDMRFSCTQAYYI